MDPPCRPGVITATPATIGPGPIDPPTTEPPSAGTHVENTTALTRAVQVHNMWGPDFVTAGAREKRVVMWYGPEVPLCLSRLAHFFCASNASSSTYLLFD
jgi:hypothetical protein